MTTDKMTQIKTKMKSGDVQGAAAALKKFLSAEPDNAEEQMLYGTCCHLLGDDKTFGILCIRANGDVLPCRSFGHAFVEDNLRRRPLAEIWNDPNSFSKFRHKSEHLTGPCAKRPFGERCGAGSTAMAISQTGKMTETPFCIRQLETERNIKEMIG